MWFSEALLDQALHGSGQLPKTYIETPSTCSWVLCLTCPTSTTSLVQGQASVESQGQGRGALANKKYFIVINGQRRG